MKNSIRVKLKKTISLLSACTLLVTSVAPLAETVFVTDAYAAEEAMEIPDEEVTEIPEAPDYEEAAVEVPDAGSEAGDPEYPDEELPDEAESSDSSEAVDEENAESDASLAPASSGSKKGIIYWNSDTPAVFLEGATDTVRVTVSAGIGAFPEGVAMNLKPADDEKTLSRIKKTVEKDGETKVADVLAVDITFVDAEGYEIEPAAPICVTMTDLTRTEIAGEIDQHGNEIRIEAENPTESAEAASNEASEDAEQPDADENDIEIAAEDGTSASADGTALAVHIDEKGRGELLPTPTDIHIKWNEEEIEENTKALQEVFADSSVIFEAEKFSVYAIVYTESNTETISDTDTDDSETEGDSELSWPGDTPSVFLEGDTDEVHVTVAAGVGVLPEGVTMTVSPVTDEDVLDRIRAAAEEDSEEAVSAVQAVDILFFDADGNEVKPAGTVCVTMKDLTEEAEASAENNVAVSLDADGNSSLPETPEEIHIEWKDEEIEENTAVLQQVFADSTVIFETEEPGVCAIVTRTIEKTLEASDGNTYVITVNYDNTSGIPANAELSVSEIKEGEEGYDDYVAQSAEKLGQEVEAFSLAKAFDITLTDPETGEKYQPNKNVSVSIRLLEEELNQDGDVNVVHFGNEVEVLECAVNEDAVEFETDGFSVYVVTYTVDFHWGDYTYSIEGESEITLSDLLEKLGVNEITLEDVKNVSFSDEELVKVEKTDGDWLLTSLKAFGTEETLTLELKNGKSVEIRVTDEGEDIPSGTWSNGANGAGTWVIDANGVLTITGHGKINDFNGVTDAPWGDYSLRNQITKVVFLDEGEADGQRLTHLGKNMLTRAAMTEIDASGCEALKDTGTDLFKQTDYNSEKGKPNNLVTVNFSGCTSFTGFGNNAFSAVRGIKTINLSETQMVNLSSFDNSKTSITTLKAENCPKWTLSDLTGYTKITDIDLSGCTNSNFKTPSLPVVAQNVDLSGCTNVTGISNLSSLTSLKDLNLSGTKVSGTFTAPASTALEKLNLSGTSITAVSDLSGNTGLNELNLSNTNITELPALPDSLTTL